MITMATASAMTNTTTMASSTPTAPEVIRPSSRVEAITSAACTISIATVISRAVSSFSAIPTNGMNAWLASALSRATTAIARYQNVSHPNSHPTFGFASREAHWYEEPLSAMRAANCATTSATSVCPIAASTHSQMPTGPAVASRLS